MMVAPPYSLQNKTYTRDDLRAIYALPENKDKLFELVNGVLIEVPPPRHIHQRIVALLNRALTAYLLQHDLGLLYTDNTGYELPDGSVVMPDLSFVANERMIPPEIEMDFAPDLAIEVVSPSNLPTEMRDKVRSFLTSGTKQVWVIYPNEREIDVAVLQADGSIAYKTYGIRDTLTGDDVLPGFSVAVADIFPK
jgi:Uma2 family endonuclease